MSFVPTRVFLTRGVGVHAEKLVSFEMALRDAQIARYNLVRVSSIFPPRAKTISRQAGLAQIAPGEIVYAVISENATNEPYRKIAASVGVAIPRDRDRHGYLSEHHSFGQTGRDDGDYAEDLAAQMLATIMGLPFDAETSWNERREYFKVGGHIIRTSNITQAVVGDRDGRWTTVLAAAVLL